MQPIAYRYLDRLMRKVVLAWLEVLHDEIVETLTSTGEEMLNQLDKLQERSEEQTEHVAILTRMVLVHQIEAWASLLAAVAGARQQRVTVVRVALRIIFLRLGVAFRTALWTGRLRPGMTSSLMP